MVTKRGQTSGTLFMFGAPGETYEWKGLASICMVVMNITDHTIDVLNQAKFTPLDYGVFGCMLLLSAITGLYIGCRNRSQAPNVQDYLLGNRNMRTFPVAMSLIGSYISGVTILGTPAEIYNFGTQYSMIVIAIFASGGVVAIVYLPVFCKLKLQSSYEYLEMRFDKSLRTMASIMFLFDEILFLPLLVYVPSLALNQVTGVSLHLIGSTVCIVCIFYTVLGGLRAVVWTDTWQVAVMFGSVLLIAIMGTYQAGGFMAILNAAKEGDRLMFFDWNMSLYQRHTAWGTLFGGCLYWTAFNSVNQTMVQRYMALPSQRKAVLAIFLFSSGAVFVVGLCCYTGLLIFERLGGCDPKSSGRLLADDQLLPAYAGLITASLPGLLGVFVAGVFGAALSSMSVVLNSSATVVLEDIVQGLAGKRPTPKTATLIARITVSLLGVASLGTLFLVERLSGILSVTTSLSAIAASTSFGIFTLGMLWPWATSRGTLIGAISGALVGSWAVLGAQAAATGGLVPPDKHSPILTGCSAEFNETVVWPNITEPIDPEEIFPLYRISYHWIAPLGIFTTLIIGILASAFTYEHGSINNLDPDLMSPIIHRFLPSRTKRNIGNSIKERGRTFANQPKPLAESAVTSSSTTLTLLSPDACDKPMLATHFGDGQSKR